MKKATTPSTPKTKTRRTKKSSTPLVTQKKPWFIIIFLSLAIALSMGIMGKYFVDKYILYSNPLIGTWRAQTALGLREIVFERESMTSFGTKTSVHYDVKGDEVVVMDTSLQLGNTYKVIDKETISSKMGTITTTYKRVR